MINKESQLLRMAICVVCSEEFDSLKMTFEQRLIDDTSFCMKCWTEIMDGDYETDLDFDLAEITQKRKS